MNRRMLPGTGLEVSSVCLGTAKYGDTVSQEDARRYLEEYTGRGGNLIDTANVYGKWCENPDNYSEQILGGFLKDCPNRNRLVISTKGGHPPLNDMVHSRLKEPDVRLDLEESLRTLGRDWTDLYWLHRDDETMPVEELLLMLEKFREEGKIRFYGCSNWSTDRIRQAEECAVKNGWRGFFAVQNRWSLARVEPMFLTDETLKITDKELYSLLKQKSNHFSLFSFSAMGHGAFSKWASGNELPEKIAGEYKAALNQKRLNVIKELSNELGCTIASLTLAWQINQWAFTAIPIAMPAKLEQLEDLFAAAELKLTQDQVRTLDCGEEW